MKAPPSPRQAHFCQRKTSPNMPVWKYLIMEEDGETQSSFRLSGQFFFIRGVAWFHIKDETYLSSLIKKCFGSQIGIATNKYRNLGNTVILRPLMQSASETGKHNHLSKSFLVYSNKLTKLVFLSDLNELLTCTHKYLKDWCSVLKGKVS